jgi:signal transduction histidine kinase
MGQLFDQFDLLGEQRRFIDLRLLPIDAATGWFKDTVGGALRVLDTMNGAIHDATEVANLRDFTTVMRFVAAAGEEHSVLTAGFAQGSLSVGQTNDLIGAVSAQDAYQASFLSQAGPSLRAAFAQRYQPGSSIVNRVHAMRSVALAGRIRGGTVTVNDWYDATTAQNVSLADSTRNVLRAVQHSGLARKQSAEHAMLFYAFGAGAALLAALALAYAIVRSTTTPLRRLTAAARDVSERQLPQLLNALHADADESDLVEVRPIELSSRDEVGELAHAFNSIETATVDVAREHASLLRQGISDLYVNLARRNQSLLERQLRVIDQLESSENDPDTLAALFRVDQFATRMRRNAESLLILAGVEPPRPGANTVRIFDVVRGAASEIDDYARIELTGVDESTAIIGRAMVDLTHLLAELLENATAFSPPETRVVVNGRRVGSSYELSVVDQGLGMSPHARATANLLLEQPPPPRLALSHSLGLLVVARLAARAGVRVELQAGSPGVVAVVSIPETVLAEPDAPPAAASDKSLPRRIPTALDAGARLEPTEIAPSGAASAADPAVAAAASVPAAADAVTTTGTTPGWTPSALPRRVRKAPVTTPRPRVVAEPRSADAVFEVVARYESGRRRGLLDAYAGAAGVTGDDEPQNGVDEPASASLDCAQDRGRAAPLPHRTPRGTAVPARAEDSPHPEARPPEEAFEIVARYEWGRRRARLAGPADQHDSDAPARVEDN